MISISLSAQKYFTHLLSKQKKNTNIRIYVKYPGTPIAKCGVSYCHISDIAETDIKIEFNNFDVFIDSIYSSLLKGAKIDCLETSQSQFELTLLAPNIKTYVMVKDHKLNNSIKNFLNEEINPQLSLHGGSVALVGITNSNYVALQFFGGCNGCSMVSNTLKEGIERKLLKKFPILKGVYDSTKHYYGRHSYI